MASDVWTRGYPHTTLGRMGEWLHALLTRLRPLAVDPPKTSESIPDPDRARFYLGRGRRARDRQQWSAALTEAHKAATLDSISPWPLVLQGECHLALGEPIEARNALHRARRRAPRNGYILDLLLSACEALNRQAGPDGYVRKTLPPSGPGRRRDAQPYLARLVPVR